jgi:hypothetical protein
MYRGVNAKLALSYATTRTAWPTSGAVTEFAPTTTTCGGAKRKVVDASQDISLTLS